MAIGNLEIRMAHLEGAYEQVTHRLDAIHEDLRGLRQDIGGVRTELGSGIGGLRAEIGSVRTELGAPIGEMRAGLGAEIAAVRHELIGCMDRQFFWMLGLIIISILLPIARSIGH